MDFIKLSSSDIRAMDAAKLQDNTRSLRKELVTMRMDVYNAGPKVNAKARNMRKTLARLLTVANEKSGAAKPATAKTNLKTAKKK